MSQTTWGEPSTALVRNEPDGMDAAPSIVAGRGGAVDISEEQIDSAVGLLQTKWGGSTDMTSQDWRAVCRMAYECGMNPVFDLDILGGGPYDNSNYWLRVLNESELVESVQQRTLDPGDHDDWLQHMGPHQDPEPIAAAVATEIKRIDRKVPMVETNYTLKDDPILFGWSDPEWFNGQTAQADAGERGKALEDDGCDVKVFQYRNSYGVKYKQLLPDWGALALKKARTTSLRRATKATLPGLYARTMRFVDQMQKITDAAIARTGGAVVSGQDPYAGEGQHVGAQSKEPTISGYAKGMLKRLAKLKGLSTVELQQRLALWLDLELDQVQSDRLTLAQLEIVVQNLEEMGNVDREVRS